MSGGDWKYAYKAVEEGDFSLLQHYVQSGIDVNYQHPEILMTFLVTAIKNNHTEMALYLLENGSDPNLESYYDQMTPLKAAFKYKNKSVLNKLAQMGVTPNWYQKLLLRFF